MMSRRAVGAVTAALLLLLAASTTGCVPEPAPSPTPAGFATEEEAFAAAEETYRSYVDALNQVDLSDPDTFEPVFAWTSGEANANERETLSQMHAEGWEVSGLTQAPVVELGRVELPSSVELLVCQDVSDVDIVDTRGNSQVSPGRPGIQSMSILLDSSRSTATGLAISKISGREGDPPCAEG
ncbi:hypothetical protein [Microbacterium sp. zg-YB36]|uniref:hypothetical protein n=1 Tax=Microbacterium sp. zg-YB36 TaxID=2969407 RepID=UPI00214C4C9D|nr:hypothetical protein [Microbacterium sp. zg-YB36]MDL5350042.1 hypothetical protein [Microbacterium sp. zg-YB36]